MGQVFGSAFELPLETSAFPILVSQSEYHLYSPHPSFLLKEENYLEKKKVMVQVLGSVPPMWKTKILFWFLASAWPGYFKNGSLSLSLLGSLSNK